MNQEPATSKKKTTKRTRRDSINDAMPDVQTPGAVKRIHEREEEDDEED
ncbi:MAG: hypothetical protein JRN09_01190 [Nitrososphaerota archaeon]|jgi:hypothetical protein|nr:hypothetical protein [Nitrososphaerota archaeon]